MVSARRLFFLSRDPAGPRGAMGELAPVRGAVEAAGPAETRPCRGLELRAGAGSEAVRTRGDCPWPGLSPSPGPGRDGVVVVLELLCSRTGRKVPRG